MWGGSGARPLPGWQLPRIYDWPPRDPETRIEGQDGPVNIESIFFNPTSPASREKIQKMSAVCMPNVGQESLYDRVSKLLESFEWSDVTFQVGAKTIKAHKLILAISSPVFKVMLYGALPELNEISIADIEPDVFQLMIDFIYKDKVDIDSLKTACELMYAAKKYMLPSLTETCVKYISEQLHVQNILTILPFAEWIQEESLMLHCLKLISNHAEFILTKKTPHITGASLMKILQQEAINISERDLIKFAIHWAHNECLERRLPPTDNNKRTMLNETGNFLQLRFLALTVDDLDWLSNLNILTKAEKEYVKINVISNNPITDNKSNETDDKKSEKEEKITFDVKSYLVSDEIFDDLDNNMNGITEENYKPAINMIETGRSQAKINWILCCRPQIRSASPLIIKNGFQNIKVTIRCDKTILVNSFSIPTRQSAEMVLYNETKGYYNENIKLEVYGTYKYLEQTSTHFISRLCYNSSTYVQLPKPYLMKELEWYTISFTWPELNNSPFKYALCYRPALSTDNLFMFNDNFENNMPCGSFIEGLKIYL